MRTTASYALAVAFLAIGASGVTHAQSCASPLALPLGGSGVSGNTCTAANQLGTLCGAFASPENDIVYSFTITPPHTGTTLTLSNQTASWNAAIVLLSGTCGPGVSCTDVAENTPAGGNETIAIPGPAGTYFLIVTSAPGSGGCGSFNLSGDAPVSLQSFSIE